MYPYFYFPMIDYYYLILVVPAVLISLWAQIKVKSTFSKYSSVYSTRNITGCDTANTIMRHNAINDVTVVPIGGSLTDNYNPRTNQISLSQPVYSNTSIAAIGVAAHESGHAVQHHVGYLPIKIRNMLVPVANIGSTLAIPIAMLGLIMGISYLVSFGILLYSAIVLFQLATLPVEFNASRRAIAVLRERDILSEQELKGAKKVLTAAALTYVAATLTSIMSLLRLILIARDRRD